MGRVYSRPCLNRVIMRVDLASPAFEVADGLPAAIEKDLVSLFPIVEPKEVKSSTVEISANGLKPSSSHTDTHWSLFGSECEKTLLIAPDHFYIEYRRYESFEASRNEFEKTLELIAEAFPSLTMNRLGVRYINHIQPDIQTDPLAWDGLLQPSLLSIFEVPEDGELVCRAFHNLVWRFGDALLTMQYGMHNPDFPAPIKKKLFVIDLDASYRGVMTIPEIKKYVGEFHEEIERAFEGAILDQLRQIMGVDE